MQMVYLNVFANLGQYSGRVPLEHWVSRIAVNVCLKQYRHERSRPELRRGDLTVEQEQMLDLLATSDRDVSAPQQVAAAELVNALLGQLKPRERIMVNFLYLEGRTVGETCALMGMSNLAVRLLAFRARKKMKKLILDLQLERVQ
jgi:RNA polymerase sigma-70 factor (ECF subfamily)